MARPIHPCACAAGICEDDIDEFCLDVMPGLGRLAICLTDQLKEQEKDGYNGARVSSGCATELDKFKRDQSDNINRDLPLGEPASLSTMCTAVMSPMLLSLTPPNAVVGS